MKAKTAIKLKVGDKWGDEIIVWINENENVLVTEGYNENACRREFNFYDLTLLTNTAKAIVKMYGAWKKLDAKKN